MENQIDLEKQIQYYQNKLNFEMDPSDLFEALERGESLVPVDTRRVKSYNKEHIPGALSLPHREINEQSTKDLDKTKTYICYCAGIGCNASTRGALKLAVLGFKVKELTGGLEWWKMDGYETHGTESSKGLEVKCAC
jgi:rhodanese-related sulfurtransferase